MKCPICNTENFFQGLFGGNCVNNSCSNYKGGTAKQNDKYSTPNVVASEPIKDSVLGPYWVCYDCLAYIVYGELPEDQESADSIVAGHENEEPYFWSTGGECEEHKYLADCVESCDQIEFTNSTCDGCGSSLAGSRHKASLILSDECR